MVRERITCPSHDAANTLLQVCGAGAPAGDGKLASALRAGLVSQMKNGSGKYKCHVCDAVLANTQTVTKHLDTKKHQTMVGTSLICWRNSGEVKG